MNRWDILSMKSGMAWVIEAKYFGEIRDMAWELAVATQGSIGWQRHYGLFYFSHIHLDRFPRGGTFASATVICQP